MMTIPRAFLDQLDLKPLSEVSLEIEGGRLVVARTRPRYSHAALLAMGPPPEVSAEDTAWDALDPVGTEII